MQRAHYTVFLPISSFLTRLKGYYPYEFVDLISYWWEVRKHTQKEPKATKLKYGSHWSQYWHYVASTKEPTNSPWIVFIHGGMWSFGRGDIFISHGQQWAKEGYNVALVTHRKMVRYSLSAMMDDVCAVVNDITKHEKYNNTDVVLGGISSGGHLASLLFLNPTQWWKHEREAVTFAGLFALATPLDIFWKRKNPLIWRLAGFASTEKFKLANPIEHLQKKEERPVFLAFANRDKVVPRRCIDPFIQKLSTHKNHALTCVEIQNGGHLDVAMSAFGESNCKQYFFEWLEKIKSCPKEKLY